MRLPTKIHMAGRTAKGFSLIELLIVLGIMLILTGLAVPAIRGFSSSMALLRGATAIGEEVDFARMSAVSKNRVVATCLYYGSPGGRILGLQSFILETSQPGVWLTLGKLKAVPSGIVLSEAQFSTLLGNGASVTPLPQIPSAIIAMDPNPSVLCVLFHSDGSMEWTPPGTAAPTLTLVKDTDPRGSSLPPNYASLVIHPQTAQVTLIRP